MLSIERRRHDVHGLFGDVIYDVRKAHWRVNNKIKKNLLLFSEYHKQFSFRVMVVCNGSLIINPFV